MTLVRFAAAMALLFCLSGSAGATGPADPALVDPASADSIGRALIHFVDRWAQAPADVQHAAIVWAGFLLGLLIIAIFGGRAFQVYLTHRPVAPAAVAQSPGGHTFEELFRLINNISERVDQLAAGLHEHIGACRAVGG